MSKYQESWTQHERSLGEPPLEDGCEFVGADGTCTHPNNMTPECHDDACPLADLAPDQAAELAEAVNRHAAYRGQRNLASLTVLRPDGSPLPLRLDLANHSPTGFESGYGGSGPAQLALALLADLLGDETALKYYQSFKWNVVALLPHTDWILSPATIKARLSEIVSDERGGNDEH